MTSVYREYRVKIKMVQEQWLEPEMKFLLGYNMKIVTYPTPPVGKTLKSKVSQQFKWLVFL